MIIKLQPDQITLFWDMIKRCMIVSNDIPKEFHQDYANSILVKLLSGKLQAWILYKKNNEEKKLIHAIFITSIIDEKFHGIRVLGVEGVYGFRVLDDKLIQECYTKTEEFAKANGCNVLMADYTLERVKDILLSTGFKIHRTICKKFI